MQTEKLLIELKSSPKKRITGEVYTLIDEDLLSALFTMLSQQAVVELTDEEEANEYATGYFISSECYDAQRDAFLAGCQHVRQQLQQQEVSQSDEEAAKEYADRQFTKPYEEMKDADQNAWIAFYEGYLAGLQEGRVQKDVEISGLKQWKAEALAVMPDMQAIGKALKVPLGQSIHDKILPAIQQLSKEKENLRNWFVQEIENLKKVNEEARQQLLKEQQQRAYSEENMINFTEWTELEGYRIKGYDQTMRRSIFQQWLTARSI